MKKKTSLNELDEEDENDRSSDQEQNTTSLLSIFKSKTLSFSNLSNFHFTYDYDNGTGELYLRVGTALFSICAMIDRCLSLLQMFEAYINHHSSIGECKITFVVSMLSKSLSLLFIFMQSFFIFKYANIIINYGKNFAEFGLVHIICTNFCVFLRCIVRETFTEIRNYKFLGDIDNIKEKYRNNNTAFVANYSKVYQTRFKTTGCVNTISFTSEIAEGIREAQDKLSPYLFPCIIEYSLICLTIFYVLYKSIQSQNNKEEIEKKPNGHAIISNENNDDNHRHIINDDYEVYKIRRTIYEKSPYRTTRSKSLNIDNENSIKLYQNLLSNKSNRKKSSSTDMIKYVQAKNNLYQHSESFQKRYAHQFTVDCGKSTTGLFIGIIVLLLTIISFINFFIYKDKNMILAMNISDTTEFILILLSLIIVVIIYINLKYHNFNYKSTFEFKYDAFLVIIGLASIYLFGFYTIIAIISNGITSYFDILSLSIQVTTIFESTFQTVLIIKAQNMCTKIERIKKIKPARSLITLLILVDVSLWLSETFSVKRYDMYDIQIAYYDIVFWSLVTTISCPLSIFFRFFSSFCLSNIWKTLYE